jgi:hypothetical protein
MSKIINLVLIHVGKTLPDYIYDCVYQCLLINHYSCKIYIIIDDSVINEFKTKLLEFDFDLYTKDKFYYNNVIQVVSLSILEREIDENFEKYKTVINNKYQNISEFRDGFWISTSSRFYYISQLMQLFKLSNVFHIENDIMMYESFSNLYKYIQQEFDLTEINKICMIKDSPNRVIPSLLFFPNIYSISNLTYFMTNTFKNSENFVNDMNLLGSFSEQINLPIDIVYSSKTNIIFDGAALGQYLGGVDFKNIPNSNNLLVQFNNPTRGFVNETSIVKPNKFNFINRKVIIDHINIPITIPLCTNPEINNIYNKIILNRIANLHIHSKQLNEFSSINNLIFKEIITGDRIISLCDFVLLTKDIYDFHQNINNYAKDVIIIKDFKNINIDLLNSHFKSFCNKQNTKQIKLFIYTHILDLFVKYILNNLDSSIQYILYIHNSDHSFNDKYKELVDSNIITKIYAQNIDYSLYNTKLNLLPIGIANSMWKHGDLVELYSTIKKTYKNKKQKNIYVNINPATYSYRKDLLDKIKELNSFNLAVSKPYNEYLLELASHRFCLCIRGNGIDTHRFWESLYLGVIPVIINNETTKCQNWINYLKVLEIPFYEIKQNDIHKMFIQYTDNFFTESLYYKIIQNSNSSIYNLSSLKLSNYS